MLDIANPRLRRLYKYWSSKRAGDRLPARADIDPLDMTYIIGNVMLADVIAEEPPRFRIRLHGTNLSLRAGYDLTSKMLDELPLTEFRQIVRKTWTKVAATAEPLHFRRDRIIDGRPVAYETIVLPLSSDGERVDMLIAALIYDDKH